MGEAFRQIERHGPRALGFVAILVVGWLVARLVRALLRRVLERTGLDRVAERANVRVAPRMDAGDLVTRLAVAAVWLIAVQTAFGLWGPNPVSTLIHDAIAWLPKAFAGIVVVVIAAAAARVAREIVGRVLAGRSYARTVAAGASAAIIGLGVLAALGQVGVTGDVIISILTAVLATVGGVVVVGVGGGLIRPMQGRWETWLDRAANDAPIIVERAPFHGPARRDETIPLSRVNDGRTMIIPPDPIPNR